MTAVLFPVLCCSWLLDTWTNASSANAWRALTLAFMRGHVYGEAARIDVIKFYFPASCSCPILALCKFGLDLPEKICCGEAGHLDNCTHHHKPPGFFFPVDVENLLVFYYVWARRNVGWCQLTHSSTSSHGLFFTQINSVKSKENGDWLYIFSPYLNKF